MGKVLVPSPVRPEKRNLGRTSGRAGAPKFRFWGPLWPLAPATPLSACARRTRDESLEWRPNRAGFTQACAGARLAKVRP